MKQSKEERAIVVKRWLEANKEEISRKNKLNKLKRKEERKEQGKQYYIDNKDKIKKQNKEYVLNPNNKDKIRGAVRKRQYGITLVEYNSLLDIQENRCAICGNEFSSTRSTHTDHDHVTGIVRGILCNKCNLGLGFFQDDVEILIKAINYLKPL